MKLLVVSHACITPLNQSFYANVAQSTGWDVSLIIPASWENEYAKTAEVTRWDAFAGEIHAIPVWKPGHIPLHVYRNPMLGLLRRLKPDVIYVHHEPYGLATAQMYIANELSSRARIGFYAAQNILKTYPLPFRSLEQYVLKRSNFAFPVTEGALEVIRRKGYTGPAEVLPLSVDHSLYHPNPASAATLRQKLQVSNDTFVIGYLGRLVREKGLETLLKALHLLRDANWRCVLVGSGPMEGSLREQSAALRLTDKVVFAGFVSHTEAPGFLAAFDVLVLPSEDQANWKEQFGRVIVEANACGTAVIGSTSGEIPRVLQVTGGGLIVPQADPESLSAAIVELATDSEKRDRLAESGLASVRQSYGQSYLVTRFAETVERSLLSRGGH